MSVFSWFFHICTHPFSLAVWKKHSKEQRKLAKKNGKPGDEEKKSEEEQKKPNVANGVDLLKRLIGTREESSRKDILNKHLAPPASPDESEGHVAPDDLLQAIAKFVDMIRTVKQSDNAPEITSAQQVAIVARLVIIEHYGDGSETLSNFEMGLGPVFAPKFATADDWD